MPWHLCESVILLYVSSVSGPCEYNLQLPHINSCTRSREKAGYGKKKKKKHCKGMKKHAALNFIYRTRKGGPRKLLVLRVYMIILLFSV